MAWSTKRLGSKALVLRSLKEEQSVEDLEMRLSEMMYALMERKMNKNIAIRKERSPPVRHNE